MKAIHYALLSYFQQHLIAVLIAVTACVVFVGATFYAQFHLNDASLDIQPLVFSYLLSLALMVSVISVHLKRLIKSSATILLPHFRQSQLSAAGIIIAVFVCVPAIYLVLYGLGFMSVVSLLLFTTALTLVLFFFVGENPITFVLVIWPVRLVYEGLGFPIEKPLLTWGTNSSFAGLEGLLGMTVIVLSFAMLYYYTRNYLGLSSERYTQEIIDDTDPWAREHDKTDGLTDKFIARYLVRLKPAGGASHRSSWRLIRLQQLALFSPTNIFSSSAFRFLVIVPFFLTILYLRDTAALDDLRGRALVLFYFVITLMLTSDFLQHRNRLSQLYLQTPSPSRVAFARATILSYLLVAFKRYLGMSLLVMCMLFILPSFQQEDLFRHWSMGAFIMITYLSISLLAGKAIKSPEAKEWTIAATIGFMIAFLIVIYTWDFLGIPFFAAAGTLSLLLLWLAWRKWRDTELDFVGL